MMRFSCRTAVIAVVAFAAHCAASDAATVSRFADILVYNGTAGRASDLRISAPGDRIRFDERSRSIEAGAGCADTGRRQVTCDAAGVSTVLVELGAGDDAGALARGVAVRVLMSGGRGDDTLTGGDEADDIRGGRGRDEVDGGGGDDAVRGGPGDDEVAGSGGDDLLEGGTGDDHMQSLDGGVDEIDCGRGDDSANAGDSDRFVSACDEIRVTNLSTGCHAGHATTDVRPDHPKVPWRSLNVKVTGANRPIVVVDIDIYRSPSGHSTVTVSVRTDGKWHFVKKVSPKYSYARPDPRCPL
jgi:hypothetical protein